MFVFFLGESPIACKLFIDHDGLNIFMGVFNTFKNNHSIHCKALQVLKNIAVEPHLRTVLLSNDLILTLRYFHQFNKCVKNCFFFQLSSSNN